MDISPSDTFVYNSPDEVNVNMHISIQFLYVNICLQFAKNWSTELMEIVYNYSILL